MEIQEQKSFPTMFSPMRRELLSNATHLSPKTPYYEGILVFYFHSYGHEQRINPPVSPREDFFRPSVYQEHPKALDAPTPTSSQNALESGI